MNRRALAAHLAALTAVALLAWLPALAQPDQLVDALQTIEDLTLLHTLQLDDRQLRQLIADVDGIVGLIATQREQEEAGLEATTEALRQTREALVLGRPSPPEVAKALEQAAQDEAQRGAEFQSQLDGRIDAVRNLMHPRQMALVEWRTEEERAATAVRPPDPEQAAFLGMALNAVDRARNLHPQRYWERLDIVAAYLGSFVPPGTAAYRSRYRRVVDIFERAIRATPEQYPTARVGLAEELLTTVGVRPESAAADRPITREALVRVLTSPGTVELLREMLQVQREGPARR